MKNNEDRFSKFRILTPFNDIFSPFFRPYKKNNNFAHFFCSRFHRKIRLLYKKNIFCFYFFLLLNFEATKSPRGMNLINIVHVFRSHQKPQAHKMLALGLIWTNLKHDKARFSKFLSAFQTKTNNKRNRRFDIFCTLECFIKF